MPKLDAKTNPMDRAAPSCLLFTRYLLIDLPVTLNCYNMMDRVCSQVLWPPLSFFWNPMLSGPAPPDEPSNPNLAHARCTQGWNMTYLCMCPEATIIYTKTIICFTIIFKFRLTESNLIDGIYYFCNRFDFGPRILQAPPSPFSRSLMPMALDEF